MSMGKNDISRGDAKARSGAPWPRVKLGEVCSRITSGGTPSTKHPEYYGGAVPWLRTQEVDFKPICDTEIKITELGLKNSAAKWIPKNAVIVAMYGATAGRAAIAKIPLTTNQACCNLIVDENQSDYRFVYYALKLNFAELSGMAKGSAQTNLSAGLVKEFEIPLPPLPLQHRIADILSAYDDKIANNRRRMELLEESARLVYRKMFGDSAWPMRKLKDVANVNESSYTTKTLPQEIDYIDIASVSRGEIKTKTHYEAYAAPGRARRIAKDGDIIWSNVRPNLKAYSLVVSPGLNDVFSTGFSVVTAKKVPFTYLYFVLSDDAFVSYLDGRVTGATYPAVKPSDFEEYRLPVPDDALLKQFHSIVLPMFRQREMLSRQNAKLAAARDILLSQLMSGRLRVDATACRGKKEVS